MSEANKPNPNLTLELNNEKLEELLQKYAEDRNMETLNELVNHMHYCRVLIPADVNENKQPIPCFINNSQKETYLPIYTSKTEMEKAPKSPAVMNLGFQAAVQISANPQIKNQGIVINPFSNNLIFKQELVKRIAEVDKKHREALKEAAQKQAQNEAAPKMKAVKLTAKQYTLLERKQFENGFLPKKFFDDGSAFVSEMAEKKEEYIDQLYEESYKEKRMYPYLAEEFPVMIMNISEELVLIRVDMPARDMEETCCRRVYFSWNPQSEKGRYFMITKAKEGSDLVEITSEGKPVKYGAAPIEGAELQEIIHLSSDEVHTS